MKIAVFEESEATRSCFKLIEGKKGFTLSFLPSQSLKKNMKGLAKSVFVYVDVSNYNEAEREKILKYLSRQNDLRYGIVDPEGQILDVTLLFSSGALDYIGEKLVKEGVKPSRMKKVLCNVQTKHPQGNIAAERVTYTEASGMIPAGQSIPMPALQGERAGQKEKAPEGKKQPFRTAITGLRPSGRNWSTVKSGQEYTFSLMFIELDHHGEFRKNLGEDIIDATTYSFKKLVQKLVAGDHGRIWIWDDFGGLVLFPFDGTKCDAVISCFRLMLNRKVICIEELSSRMLFSYRIVLHIGNTIYRQKGKTGTLISDSINSIYHIGKKYANPGNLYITKDVLPYVPEKLRTYFIPVVKYEGLELLRMLLPQ
jgi:hypothetical protein